MRILIVGQNPADRPLDGSHTKSMTFRKLDKWAEELDIGMYAFINTVPERGAATMKNVQWDYLRQSVTLHKKVIALGGFASSVLTKLNVDHFRLPHPSPRNRLLNDKKFEAEQLRLCKKYLNG